MIVAVIDSAQVNIELSSREAWGNGVLPPPQPADREPVFSGTLLLAAALCTLGPGGWEGKRSPWEASWGHASPAWSSPYCPHFGGTPVLREAEGIAFLSSQSVFPLAQNENGQTISI